MLRGVKNVVHCALLNDLAVTHDDHAVAHAGDYAHVVGDQHDAGAGLPLQLVHQLQHLRLHGHVKRRGRLVGDQQFWSAQHGDGNHHALAHAAGQLVRELVKPAGGFRNADVLQPVDAALVGLVAFQAFVQRQDFAHLGADRHVRRQAGQRVLEDHRHLGAADLAQLRLRGRQHVGAIEQDPAGGGAILGEQAHRCEGRLALAGAAFADNAKAFTGRYLKGNSPDSVYSAVSGIEVYGEVFHGQDRHAQRVAP